MRILIVGRGDGWMGLHLSHFSKGFRSLGHDVRLIDYHVWDKKNLFRPKIIDTKTSRLRRQTLGLKQLLIEYKPHMVLLIPAHQIFDLDIIREIYPGLVIFYDMDGRLSGIYSSGFTWINRIDFLLTVSRAVVSEVPRAYQSKIHYLPHGVDTDYYHPIPLSHEAEAKYHSPVAFVGRPSARRVKYLETIAEHGLALWGGRWARRPFSGNPILRPCIRGRSNIIGDDLVKLYRATRVMVNILRESPLDASTIMSLQVFSIPSTGTCLITEWVEELEDSFDPDHEILTFKSIEAFQETTARIVKEPAVASKIGEAGRRRCTAQHTHRHRAEELLRITGL